MACGGTESWGPGPGPIEFTSTECPLSVVGEEAVFRMPVFGGYSGPWNVEVVAGSLPPGMAVLPGGRAITGTPTAAGAFAFQLRITDECPTADEGVFCWHVSSRAEGEVPTHVFLSEESKRRRERECAEARRKLEAEICARCASAPSGR